MSQKREIDPRYIVAARMYIFSGATETEIAAAMGIKARETINRWRHKPMWQDAVKVVLAEGAGDALARVYRRLLASAEGEPGGPGITACNTLLDRIEGTLAQRKELSGPGGGPIPVEATHDLSANLTTPERMASVVGILGGLGGLVAGGLGEPASSPDSEAD